MWNVINTILLVTICVASAVLGLGEDGAATMMLLFCLVGFLPGLGVQVRRLHDTGRSGWWMLLTLLPVVGYFVLLLIMGFIKGERGGNRFGNGPSMA